MVDIYWRIFHFNISGDKTENSFGNKDYWIVKTRFDGEYPMAEYYWR
jgi:hypothetical protein